MKDQIGTLAFAWQGDPTTTWAKAVGGQINTGTASGIALYFRTAVVVPMSCGNVRVLEPLWLLLMILRLKSGR